MIILSFDVGIVNLAYCIFNTTTKKILHWEVIAMENIKDHNKLQVSLITNLDRRPQLLNHIDTVLIEKQPSFNPKMRIISGCLQTYFFIRGVVDAEPTNKIKLIKFFSPKHKLKCYSGPALTLNTKSKSKYTQTKKMGILIAKEKLKEYLDTSMLPFFETHKKQDDLADSYLQAITYAMFERCIDDSMAESDQDCMIESDNDEEGKSTSKKTKKRKKTVTKKNNITTTIKPLTKPQLKKHFKEYLDPLVLDSLTVLDRMNNVDTGLNKVIHGYSNKELLFQKFGNGNGSITDLSTLFTNLSMKTYLGKKFIIV